LDLVHYIVKEEEEKELGRHASFPQQQQQPENI